MPRNRQSVWIIDADHWPRAYRRAASPSGDRHVLVARLGPRIEAALRRAEAGRTRFRGNARCGL